MKIKDGVCGLVVADALGVPVEFQSREKLKENPIVGMVGYGSYNQPPGTFSDDSSLTLATINSLVRQKSPLNIIDYDNIMKEFVKWRYKGKYTPYGEAFDIGNTTKIAIENYKNGSKALSSGGKNEKDNGNGSLMRILPIAFYLNSREYSYEVVDNLSALTHAHERSKLACNYYIQIAISILNNDLSLKGHIETASNKIQNHYKDSKELIH